MKLLVGLGNPGAQYAHHRHSVGFQILDAIHECYDFEPWRNKFKGLIASGLVAGDKIYLFKPETYMNESGRAVQALMRFFKIDLSDVSVFYDEIDLAPGKVKIKTGGGSGGHNGIRSLDAHIGPLYQRVRVGVGHPGHKALVVSYVLSDFSKADRIWLNPLKIAIAESLPFLITKDFQGFLNRLALQKQSVEGASQKTRVNDAKSVSGTQSISPQPVQNKKEALGPMSKALKSWLLKK